VSGADEENVSALHLHPFCRLRLLEIRRRDRPRTIEDPEDGIPVVSDVAGYPGLTSRLAANGGYPPANGGYPPSAILRDLVEGAARMLAHGAEA
jgi:hypothetical protein